MVTIHAIRPSTKFWDGLWKATALVKIPILVFTSKKILTTDKTSVWVWLNPDTSPDIPPDDNPLAVRAVAPSRKEHGIIEKYTKLGNFFPSSADEQTKKINGKKKPLLRTTSLASKSISGIIKRIFFPR